MRIFSHTVNAALLSLIVLTLLSACTNDSQPEQTVTNNSADSATNQVIEPAVAEEEERGAAFPETDIYLSRMLFKGGTVSIGEPVNITARSGYDNQPYFLPDNNTILFSSRHNLEQTDLFSYSIGNKKITRLTDTPESEYSPTLTPDSKSISTVRVEMDGIQRLWEVPIAGPLSGITANNENFSVVFPEVVGIGYHAWVDQDNAYVFIVDANGDKHKLAKASRIASGSYDVTKQIGRSIRVIPETSNISFIAKDDVSAWYVVEHDTATAKSKVLTATVPGSEDLVWLDELNLLMAKDNRIYHRNLSASSDWMSLNNSSLSAVKGDITRIAASPNMEWLAFVVTHNVDEQE